MYSLSRPAGYGMAPEQLYKGQNRPNLRRVRLRWSPKRP